MRTSKPLTNPICFAAVLAVLLGGLASVPAAGPKKAAAVATLPPVKGVIKAVVKSETSDSGTIAVELVGADGNVNPGSVVSFTVTEATIFEKVVGHNRSRSQFLEDHKGEDTVVIPLAQTPGVAHKVEIHFQEAPMYCQGVVAAMKKGTVTVKVHHFGYSVPPPPPPPPAVLGVITDIQKDQNNPTGTITVKPDGSKPTDPSRTFAVDLGTGFEIINGAVRKGTTFLEEHKGEKAAVHPDLWNPLRAAQVQIILAPPPPAKTNLTAVARPPAPKPAPAQTAAGGKTKAAAKPQGHQVAAHDDFVVFNLEPATKFETVRGKNHQPVPEAMLQLGEKVLVISERERHRRAAKVEIDLPAPVHGKIAARDGSSITLQLHHQAAPHGSASAAAADSTHKVAIGGMTKYESVLGHKHTPAAAGALNQGADVVVFAGALPQLPAEKVEIIVHPPKPITIHGTVLAKGNGTITVKEGKGGTHTFQISGATKFHSKGKDKKPASFALLTSGTEVVVAGKTTEGQPSVADSVEVHAKDPKAKPKDKKVNAKDKPRAPPPPPKPPAKKK